MQYSKLIVTKTSRRKWRLVEDWITPFGTVPARFETDGASVPRALWWLFSPAGVLFQASVIHDHLYSNAINTKQYADNAFKLTAITYKARKHEAMIAHWFVKWFGKGKY
ncbi:MAG: DUF1353 domain-containing protein [Aliivibrio sp.]|uniref:DUF1353 domain-containing protein n=1 Tax=Aliivibrio sp. TaxID=1872443 RepID=UPI001A60310A|nr:DUF1353 domain-containing protein [Aliivibrio sp.]